MKLAFSTLGCPFWTWDEIISTAKDLGMNGIEVRGVYNEINAPDAPPFQKANLAETKDRLKRLGLEICLLSSSVVLSDKKNIDAYMIEAKDYIWLAAELGTRYVRVLADKSPEVTGDVDGSFVAEKLSELCEYALKFNITIIVETNGIYADTTALVKLIESIGCTNVGILWDIHHPFRYFNEPIEKSYENIKKYLKHIHVKHFPNGDSAYFN